MGRRVLDVIKTLLYYNVFDVWCVSGEINSLKNHAYGEI